MYVTVRASGACARSVVARVRSRPRRPRRAPTTAPRVAAPADRARARSRGTARRRGPAPARASPRRRSSPRATLPPRRLGFPGAKLSRQRLDARWHAARDRTELATSSSTSPGGRTTARRSRMPSLAQAQLRLDTEVGQAAPAGRAHAEALRPHPRDRLRRVGARRRRRRARRPPATPPRAAAWRGCSSVAHARLGADDLAVVRAVAAVDRHRRSRDHDVQRRAPALAHRLRAALARWPTCA